MEQNYSSCYFSRHARYKQLAQSIKQTLVFLLDREQIKYLGVDTRVKTFTSFLEKIKRKNYSNPFQDMEDLCGIRIICYYQSDLERISELLSETFSLHTREEKDHYSDHNRFGYRSNHFIIQLKPEWIDIPIYSELNNLKAEVQVRTLLMHTWAEIEHQLGYKGIHEMPEGLQRKFSRISAKLEEADEQFDELRQELSENIRSMLSEAIGIGDATPEILTLDALQSFLSPHIPNQISPKTEKTLGELLSLKIELKDMVTLYGKFKTVFQNIDQQIQEHPGVIAPAYQSEIAKVMIDFMMKRYEHEQEDKPLLIQEHTTEPQKRKVVPIRED